MNSNINIVLASDNNYAQHLGIVISSCINKSNHTQRLCFYILSSGISDTNKNYIEAIANNHSASCIFIEPDTSIYSDISKKRFGVAALFRLSLGTLLPSSVRRAIYLDCDVLLYSDINELWEIDLENHIAGAAINLGYQPTKRLNIKEGEYFNSGVLLIDLDRWRKNNIGLNTLKYMTDHNEILMYPDQDGLNVSLQGQWKKLPLRWNAQPSIYSSYAKARFDIPLSSNDYYEAITNPAIIHFLGEKKPWNYLSFHPLKKSYTDYLKVSPWKDYTATDYHFLNIIKKWASIEKNIKQLQRRSSIPEKVKRI